MVIRLKESREGLQGQKGSKWGKIPRIKGAFPDNTTTEHIEWVQLARRATASY